MDAASCYALRCAAKRPLGNAGEATIQRYVEDHRSRMAVEPTLLAPPAQVIVLKRKLAGRIDIALHILRIAGDGVSVGPHPKAAKGRCRKCRAACIVFDVYPEGWGRRVFGGCLRMNRLEREREAMRSEDVRNYPPPVIRVPPVRRQLRQAGLAEYF